MEAVLLAFALGAGTVFAARHGRRIARRAVGWSATQAGRVSAQVTSAMVEARDIARREYERGKAPLAAKLVDGTANGEARPESDGVDRPL